ncbi:UDP-glucuronate:xylan alpha-glucuronosyltransferase 2-like [Carex rostrata]
MTVLHSSDEYVCGAIVLAHSIRKVGFTRDLILLHDEFLTPTNYKLFAMQVGLFVKSSASTTPILVLMGCLSTTSANSVSFSLLTMTRLCSLTLPLWSFVTSTCSSNFPSISAHEEHDSSFNSGVMVVEPSNCTFKTMMLNIQSMKSYNGGEQGSGFLNEIFV